MMPLIISNTEEPVAKCKCLFPVNETRDRIDAPPAVLYKPEWVWKD